MDVEDGRRSSGGFGTKSEGHSEFGGTSGIGSGTQSPTITVPTADDGLETDDVRETEEATENRKFEDGEVETDEGYTESDQDHGHSRQQREVKFSDQDREADRDNSEECREDESSDEAEEQKPGTPAGSEELEAIPVETFTIFAILPTKDVITLRDIPSGSSVSNIQSLIELSGGIPSECYALVSSSNATKLTADTRLILGETITNGSVMRITPRVAWTDVFRAIWHSDLDFVHKSGEICLMSNMDAKESEEREKTYRYRLFLCLFMACAKGDKQMCQLLLDMGADVTERTSFGNTALHAAARHNQLILVDLLLKNGAKSCPNVFGKTVNDVAKEAGAFSCERYLRLHNWSLTGQNYVISPKPSPRTSKPTSATSQRSSQSGRFSKSHVFLGAGNVRRPQTGQLFSDKVFVSSSANLPNMIRRRCQSAPVGRDLQVNKRPSTTQSRTRKVSKYHTDCIKKNSIITVSKPQQDYLGPDTVKYVAHPSVADAATVENVHVFMPSAEGEAGHTRIVKDANADRPVGDLGESREKDNEDPDRTILAETLYRWDNDQNKRRMQNKPRAKSASPSLYKSQFHKYLEPEEPVYYSRVKERRLRRAQTASASPEDEERRMKNEAAFQSWMAKKTAEGAFSAQENEAPVLHVRKHTKEENERAFEEWLEEKEDEKPRKLNCQEKRIDRENVVQFGSTSAEEVAWPSPEENHLSYQRWLRDQAERGRQQSTDEPTDVMRRRIEEKRRKTILNVKAYEEWLEEKHEEAEFRRMLSSEKKQTSDRGNEEFKKQRAPKQVSFSKWVTMKEKKRMKENERQKRDEMERREEERLLDEDWRTGTNVKTFKEWYLMRGKQVKAPKEGADDKACAELARQKEERAKMAKDSFENWAVQKALQDLRLEKARLREEERRLNEARGRSQQTRLH